MDQKLKINGDRFLVDLEALREFGKQGTGVIRPAFSPRISIRGAGLLKNLKIADSHPGGTQQPTCSEYRHNPANRF